MLRPRKRITKKELKHDPVVSTYEKGLAFYYENKKYVSYAVTALVVLVIVTVVYANNRRASNERAAAELGKIFQLYDAGQFTQAIDGVPERGVIGLKAIVENYTGASAELARFYLGNCYYRVGKYDDAIAAFEAFTSPDELLESSALAGIAACYEATGDHGSAAKYFEKAADKAPESPSAAEYLAHAAYNYGLSGGNERAVTLYKRVKKDYPNSSYAREVDRYVTQFSM